MKTAVIYHSADYDGIFCREIARKFLPDAEFIGWDFGDAPVSRDLVLQSDNIYVLDLPIDKPFGLAGPPQLNTEKEQKMVRERLVWIDHHKTAIESHPSDIPGYRIDGVAACRLAWQWFSFKPRNTLPPFDFVSVNAVDHYSDLPSKEDYIDRKVIEPIAVRLAGEYDIWDKRDPNAETFQYGLRFVEQGADFWEALLDSGDVGRKAVFDILEHGRIVQTYQRKMDANLVKHRSFRVEFEGLKFLALNTGQFNSLTFAALDVPETGHDALMGFRWDGKQWSVSLYHAKHRTDLDLSEIAKRFGGGGHRGACGFSCPQFPFVTT